MKSQQQDTTILEQIIEPKVEDTLEKVIAKKTTSQIIDSTVANIVNDTNTNTVEAIKFDSATVVKADNYTQFFETHHLQPKVYFTRTRTEPTPDWYIIGNSSFYHHHKSLLRPCFRTTDKIFL